MGSSATDRIPSLSVGLRSVIYTSGFVGLWAWIATSVRVFDDRIPITIPYALHSVGIVLVVLGAVLAALCIATFFARGRGTPAPFDPPREFVASGPYRYVRNPMYVGGFGVILGSGLMVRSPSIALLAFAFLLLMHLVVVFYEEPNLTARFGDSYARYRSSVGRWFIRAPVRSSGIEGDSKPPLTTRIGSVLLAVSAVALLAAPIVMTRAIPDLTTRGSRHAFAGALGLVALAILEFVLAVGPIRRGERWAVAAATVPFVIVGLPVLFVDATYVARERLWNTLAPQVFGLTVGTVALVLCAWPRRR